MARSLRHLTRDVEVTMGTDIDTSYLWLRETLMIRYGFIVKINR